MTRQAGKGPPFGGNPPKSDLDVTKSMFDLFTQGHAFWWPYLSVSKVLLQTQENAMAYLKANRKLAQDMQAITRKEHELIVDLSEQFVDQMTQQALSGRLRKSAPANLDSIYEQAAKGIRELGQAWIEAQLRSLEILRENSKKRRD